MTRLWPSLLNATRVVQPETILRWHRAGFRAFWRWKSRKRAGRPKIDRELRDLILRMSQENPKWGASRIHGELLTLGFEVAQSTVSKYKVQGGSRRRWLFSSAAHGRPGPKGPSKELIHAIIEFKRRNPRIGCPLSLLKI
jgi:homeodomain-containing protein